MATRTPTTRARKPAAKPAAAMHEAMTGSASTVEKTAAKAGEAIHQAANAAADTAAQLADAFSMPGFGMPDIFRSASEQTLAQMRDGYTRLKDGAEETTDMLEETIETARDGLFAIQAGSLDAAKAHSDAVFAFMKDLMGTHSLADAVQMQTAFARERFEAFVDYSKDVQSRVGAVAEQTAKPAKAAYDKAAASVRAA